MTRLSAAAWTVCTVPVVVAGLICARRHHGFRRPLEKLQRATRAIDANLAEIQKLREERPRQSDENVAELTRQEFADIDFAALAERLSLKPEPTKK